MDTWNKYKNKQFKQDLNKINISEAICYGNLLIHDIVWRVIHNKRVQRQINKLFEVASLIFQATCKQKGLVAEKYKDMLNYIDSVLNGISSNQSNYKEIAMLLGNLTEYTDTQYTFVERIAFVRFIANEI